MALPLSGLLLGCAHLRVDQPAGWRPLQRRSTRSHVSGELELELSWRPLLGDGAQAAAAAGATAAAAAIASPAPPPHAADAARIPAPERAHGSAAAAAAAAGGAPHPSGSFWESVAPERGPPAARPTLEPAWAAGRTAPPVALEFSSCVAQSAPWDAAATAEDKDFWAEFDAAPSSSLSFGGAADVASALAPQLAPAETLSAVRPGAASLGGGGSSSLWDDLASLEPGGASTSTSPDLQLDLNPGLNLDLDRDLGLGNASLDPRPPAGAATPGGVAGAADAEAAPRSPGLPSGSFWDAHAARPASGAPAVEITPPGSPACASLSSAGGSVGAPVALAAPAARDGGGRRAAREARRGRRNVASADGEPELMAAGEPSELAPPSAGTFWDTYGK